ncbi:hypothetical protein [Dyella sp.]|uniref:hypothetical protein n=1 Tax=Dyella sp. TaxID=1869338 RepID=UPI002B4A7EDC|nr:hypothetical protein [Dyella sp.]HKT27123.1 hypothetical protein [Dyella sp.]
MVEHRSSDLRSGSHRQKNAYRQNADEAQFDVATQAMKKAGGAGGISGTGQALPHHGFGDEDNEREVVGNPVGEEAALRMPENGDTYQAGGTHLNRLRQQETRKARLSGSTVASDPRGGLDPAPGAPIKRE